jgi:hypothetical protein
LKRDKQKSVGEGGGILGEEERERRSGMIEIVWKTSSSVMSDI